MSKQSAVLELAEKLGRRLGASSGTIDGIKAELSALWGGDEAKAEAAAPVERETTVFEVTVGVEVYNDSGARRSDVVAGVQNAVERGAADRNEVRSFSVA